MSRMRWSAWFVIAVCTALTVSIGCGDSDPEESTENRDDRSCELDCEIGETRCDNGEIVACTTVDGCPAWTEALACRADEKCEDGQCIRDSDDCPVDCEIGTSQCRGGDVEHCIEINDCPDWSVPVECAEDQVCESGLCRPDCDDECEEGTRRCDGDGGVQLCQTGDDGCTDWSDPLQCPDQFDCEDGQCAGDCPDRCELGQTRCDGDQVEHCEFQSDGCPDWSSPVECPADAVCEAGECSTSCDDECTEGATECDNDNLTICQAQPDGCNTWSQPFDCGDDLTCDDGQCISDCDHACDEDELRCAGDGVELCEEQPDGCRNWSGPFGCPDDTLCTDGVCETVDGEVCSPDNPDGECPDDQTCDDGECIPEECSSQNPDGQCPPGQFCDDGDCVDSQVCDCSDDQVCIDGRCRPDHDACSQDNPDGLCDSGWVCIQGQCISEGTECGTDFPDGFCPAGQWCDNGECVDLDDSVCNDRNECTTSGFDYDYNLCLNEPADDAGCDDGNACTDNWCDGGQCRSEPIDGCTPPPELDPFPSRTNDDELVLTGTKPPGSAIEVDGEIQASGSPDTQWEFEPSLESGDNTYEIRWSDGDDESAVQTVELHYDTEPPETRVTPEGGSFLDGITVEAVTDEPAEVFYTTDGTEPTTADDSFRSIRRFRVFEPTRLRLRARDDAGNWEDEIVEADFDVTSYANRWTGGIELPDELRDTAATVVDETVYIAGGTSADSTLAGVRARHVDADQWTNLESLGFGRAEASLVDINGWLYVIGGTDGDDVFNTVERLDPDGGDGSWAQREGMAVDRHGHQAVARDGEIFVFGGKDSGGTVRDILEVYDVGSDSWSNDYAQMPRERYDFEAVFIRDHIYLIGGVDDDGDPLETVDIYDPDDDSWSTGASMPTPRSGLAAGVLRGTNDYNATHQLGIVAAGGIDDGGEPSAVVEEYDPDSDTWTRRTPMDRGRDAGAALALDTPSSLGGQRRELWVLGGATADGQRDDVTVFSRDLEYKRHLSELPQPRYDHGATTWNDRIWIVGGRHDDSHPEAWSFDPETGSYIEVPDLPEIQNGPGVAALHDRVWVVGGEDESGNSLSTVHALDPVQEEWLEKEPMPSSRAHPAVVGTGDQLYAIGGDNGGAQGAVQIYDRNEDHWSIGPSLDEPRIGAAATFHDGDLYVVGGVDTDGDYVTSVERLPAGADAWQTVDGLSPQIAYGTAFSLGDDILATLGGSPGLEGRLWAHHFSDDATADIEIFGGTERFAAAVHRDRPYLIGGNTAPPEAEPTGTSTVRKFHPHGCTWETTPLMPGWCIGFETDPIFVVDYSPGTSGLGGSRWKGYRFQLETTHQITKLYGGGSGSGDFYVALYRADGDTPTEILASFEQSGERRAELPLDEPIELVAGQDYILAQGQDTLGNQLFLDTPIDADAIEEETIIDVWNPTVPDVHIGWEDTRGPPEVILGEQGDDEIPSERPPDMGLGFD